MTAAGGDQSLGTTGSGKPAAHDRGTSVAWG